MRCKGEVLFAVLISACGSSAAESPQVAPSHAPAISSAEASSPEASAPASAETPVRVVYDLAAHLDRAELRHGDAYVVDFGGPGAAASIGGGFGNAMTLVEEGGRRMGVSRGKRATFVVPGAGEGAWRVRLHGRGFGSGRFELFVNGRAQGTVMLPTTELGTATIEIPAAVSRPGDVTVQLLAARTGAFGAVPDAGIAVAWLRVERADGAGHEGPPLAPTLASDGKILGLGLEAEWAVGYAFEVPEGARLRAVVRGTKGARLSVRAERDGEATRDLATVVVDPGASALDVDLAKLEGHVVRLDLRASGGRVELLRPAVVQARMDTPAPKKIRNVLVYLIDTLRADKLGPINPKTRVRTPGLDRFVARSATFSQARAQENWTKPSVATLLSSLMPWEHTATKGESVLPASVRTLPMILREHGFYAGAFIANGYVSDRFGFRGGWHTYRNYIRESRRSQAEHVAADVLSWLDARPADKPFVLYVHTIDPHVPYRPPESFLAMYGDPKYTGPVNFRKDATLLENVKMGRIRLDERDREHLEALYDGEISYHDVHFAAILEALERRGLGEETMVVVTSDHGEEFWDHGSVGHGHSVWDELLHVPLFVRLPGVTDGPKKIASAVGLVDVLPTILDALELPIPSELAGRSLLPDLRGEGSSAPRASISGFHDTWRAVASGRHKLIQRAGGGVQLFDVAADPHEERDLAVERPLVTRHLRSLLALELLRTTPTPATPSRGPERSAPRPRHREQKIEIDPATEAQLRALGYVGSSKR